MSAKATTSRGIHIIERYGARDALRNLRPISGYRARTRRGIRATPCAIASCAISLRQVWTFHSATIALLKDSEWNLWNYAISWRKQVFGLLGLIALQGSACGRPLWTLPSQSVRYRPFELRLGVYAHDPVSPEKGSVDLNGEVLFDAFGPRDLQQIRGILVPRLHAGRRSTWAGRRAMAIPA